MLRYMVAAALAAGVASVAVAQTPNQRMPQTPAPSVQERTPSPDSTIGQGRPDGQVHSPNPRNDTYDSRGNYVGSDPDPRVRQEMKRDAPGPDGNVSDK